MMGELVLEPVPQEFVQVVQSAQVKAQLTGHAAALQLADADKAGHSTPP